jgi:tRNA(Arg) A34 adenosine deaminase TadA
MQIKERITELSVRDKRWLEKATELARLSTCRQKHGAIIVKGGRIVGVGVNTFRNLPISDFPSDSYTTHAESAALRSVKQYRQVGKIGHTDTDFLVGSKLYVARVNRRNVASLSRPCDGCYSELLKAGIKEIIYTV